MKKFVYLYLAFLPFLTWAQPAEQQDYYKDIDFTLTGVPLKKELTKLIKQTHTKELSYKQIWDAIKATDTDPNAPDAVILLYAWPQNSTTDYRKSYNRAKDNNGGLNGQWNREHTYAKSLATPKLVTSVGESNYTGNQNQLIAGTDAHHLRSCDVEWNATRGNLKFADGSGNSGAVSQGWYPGDEWKGDVARMMMYMYVRYEALCLPAGVGVGSTSQTPDGMIDLFLKWNAEDPVSAIEIQRNDYHANRSNPYAQGNRNPFIDNPRLATAIWGGPLAEDRWGTNLTPHPNPPTEENPGEGEETPDDILNQTEDFIIYPNPTYDRRVFIQTKLNIRKVRVFSLKGQVIKEIEKPIRSTKGYDIRFLPHGVFLLQIHTSNNKISTQKIIVN